MKTTLLILFVSAFTHFGFCQHNLSEEQVAEYTTLSQDLSGTYQIQMIDTRSKPTIQLSLFPQIESLRDQVEVKYLNVNANMRILVLPYSTIQSEGFQELDRISFISSDNL